MIQQIGGLPLPLGRGVCETKSKKGLSRHTWWTFRYFLFFFCSGRGKGEFEAGKGGGDRFLLKIPGGGVFSGQEGPRGREGLRRIGEFFWGGGAKYFFSGPKCPPSTETPPCIGFTVFGGGLRPWSQTMVSERARPWGRGRSELAS